MVQLPRATDYLVMKNQATYFGNIISETVEIKKDMIVSRRFKNDIEILEIKIVISGNRCRGDILYNKLYDNQIDHKIYASSSTQKMNSKTFIYKIYIPMWIW
jgi:hypothetical protein